MTTWKRREAKLTAARVRRKREAVSAAQKPLNMIIPLQIERGGISCSTAASKRSG
jgi:hypothetical protein